MTNSEEAIADVTELSATNLVLDELRSLLQRLDRLLERAVVAAQTAYGSEAATDPYRGLHISQQEVEQLLAREPGVSLFQRDGEKGDGDNHTQHSADDSFSYPASNGTRLAWFQQTFGLSDFDVDMVAIALAPEIDRRYERLYAYLQDDVTCKQPTVDLALNLLCPSGAAKLMRRDRFAPDAPLLRHGLLHLVPDRNQVKSTLLAQYLQLDEQVIRLLLGQKGLDIRLVSFCQLVQPTVSLKELHINPEIKQALSVLVVQDWQGCQPLRLYFQGSDRISKRRTAEALAAEVQAPLLAVDLARIVEAKVDFESTLKRLFREAWFQNALLYLDGLDVVQSNDQAISYQCLLAAVAENRGITILSGVQPWAGARGIVTVPFTLPDFAQRRRCWEAHLTAAGIRLDEVELDALVERFRLTPDQIANAVTVAGNTARWQAAARGGEGEITEFESQILKSVDLYAAARAQSGHDLATLARKIEPKYSMDDIVLPADQQRQLQEICNQAKYRHIVYGQWGFEGKLSVGKGLNVLFSGPPGTGKTMAAEIMAHELQLDLYKIDLSQVVSKYIGETEKNLNRIFTAAESANAILFFDEADALFGKRSEVKDSHDRYANLEIAYLLQKMEEYEGISILTSNLRQNLDEAFTRRIRFIVEFPFPEEESRLQIWQGIWPKQMPLGADVDLPLLARQFKLAGGNIRNIALAAAFLAAEDGQCVGMKQLLQATKREFQKMGRLVSDEEFVI